MIENFRPGVVKKLGIDYDAVRAFNPEVIYASMSGFGQTGPYGKKGGFDIIAQGMSGIMTMTGDPGGRPAKVGIAMNDIASGVTALSGILGRLHRAAENRQGPVPRDLAARSRAGLDAVGVRCLLRRRRDSDAPPAAATAARRPTRPIAPRTVTSPPAPATTSCGRNFCTLVCEQARLDERSALRDRTGAAREHRRARAGDRGGVDDPADGALGRQARRGRRCRAGPVYRYDEILADPHIAARQMVVDIEHPKIGPMKTIGLPLKSSGELTAIRKPAPWLGQHSEPKCCADRLQRQRHRGVVRREGHLRSLPCAGLTPNRWNSIAFRGHQTSRHGARAQLGA